MQHRLNAVALSYAQVLIKAIAALASTPIIVRSLGQEEYGLFVLVGAMASFLYLLDFGLNDGVIRFFVANETDKGASQSFLSRMLGFYTILGAVVVLLTAVLALAVEPVFRLSLSKASIQLVSQMLIITGVGAGILIASNPVGALLSASERFVFLRSSDIISTVLSTALIVILLKYGFRATSVVVVMSGSMVMQVIARCIYLHISAGISLMIARPNWKELRLVGGFAAPIFVSMIAELIFWKSDQLVLGVLVGASAVAVYSIGLTFNKYFMSFATAISRVMTPQIVRTLDAGASPSEIGVLLVKISRLQAIALLLVLVGLTVFGEMFIVLWVGEDFRSAYYVMLAVLVPYAFELVGNARNIVLQVKGLYWFKSTITICLALLNVALTLVLVPHLGLLGAAISTGIAITLNYILIAILLQVYIQIDMTKYFRETTRGIVPVAGAVMAAGFAIRPFLTPSWTVLGVGAAVLGAVYCGAIFMFAANQSEKERMKAIARRMVRRRRRSLEF